MAEDLDTGEVRQDFVIVLDHPANENTPLDLG